MKKFLPLNIAVWGTVIILSCVIGFHFLVVAGIIPFNIVWGGNIVDKNQLYTMEALSIAINCAMILTILSYWRVIKLPIRRSIIIAAIWLMFALFLLNTLGNLMAKHSLETFIFTPITLILSFFCFRMAAYPEKK